MVSDFPEFRCLVKDDCGSFPANVTYSSFVQVFHIEKALKYCVLATSPEPANKIHKPEELWKYRAVKDLSSLQAKQSPGDSSVSSNDLVSKSILTLFCVLPPFGSPVFQARLVLTLLLFRLTRAESN